MSVRINEIPKCVAASASPIAVTIGVGEKHRLLATLASESCRRATGLDTYILDADTMARQRVKKPHHLKFRLFKEFPDADTILYFDADTIFLKPFDITPHISQPEFTCVRDVWDRNWIYEDAARIGIPAQDYFNSGMFILNRRHHALLLETAEQLLGTIVSQFRDQTVLNAARSRLNIPASYLNRCYNYLAFENCPKTEDVVIGHLNGIHGRPAATILRYYQFWRRTMSPDSETKRRMVEALSGKQFRYVRVGYDSRIIEFRADGSIGRGGGRRERRWEITDQQNELVLWLIGEHQPICGLTHNEDHVWTGRWMRFEQMPIEIKPLKLA